MFVIDQHFVNIRSRPNMVISIYEALRQLHFVLRCNA